MAKDAHQPFFYADGHRVEARVGRVGEFEHWFGDSGLCRVKNPPEPAPVQQLLDLDLRDPRLGLTHSSLMRLPLYFPFQYEQGFMKYYVDPSGAIEITGLDIGSYDEEWPYENYPERFEKLSVDMTTPQQMSLNEFSKDVWQGVRTIDASGKFVAIVPPSSLYHACLWDEEHNMDHISIKFYFEPASRTVQVHCEGG